IDTIVFDKTGTLTAGKPEVDTVLPASGFDAGLVLGLAALLEAGSEHPAGEAIVARAAADGVTVRGATVSAFRAVAGRGAEGTVDHDGRLRRVLVGTASLLESNGVDTTPIAAELASARVTGRGAAAVAIDGRAAGVLAMRDTVKTGARDAVAGLRRMGADVWLLSGDTRAVADAIATEVCIAADRVMADVLPDGKAAAPATPRRARHAVAGA